MLSWFLEFINTLLVNISLVKFTVVLYLTFLHSIQCLVRQSAFYLRIFTNVYFCWEGLTSLWICLFYVLFKNYFVLSVLGLQRYTLNTHKLRSIVIFVLKNTAKIWYLIICNPNTDDMYWDYIIIEMHIWYP
jgi:hypothetical protein